MAGGGFSGDGVSGSVPATAGAGSPTGRKARRQQMLDAYDQYFAEGVPDYAESLMSDRRKRNTVRRALKSGSLPMVLSRINSLSDQYGYNDIEEFLGGSAQEEYQGDGPDLGSADYERGQTPQHGAPDLGPATDLKRDSVDYQKGGRGFFAGMEDYAKNELSDPDGRFEKSLMLSELSRYATERLGKGLTDTEYNAMLGGQIEGVEAQAAQSRRSLGASAAASGMDPRMQAAMMGGVESSRLQGRAGANRAMVLADLDRKRDMENLGLGVAGGEMEQEAMRQERIRQAEALGLDVSRMGEDIRQFDVSTEEGARQYDVDLTERARQYNAGLTEDAAQYRDSLYEQGRQFDVGTDEGRRQFDVRARLGRRADLENLLYQLAGMGEARREYDLGFAESRRQARMNRELLKQMMGEAEPTGLEEAGSILGGIRGGLFGGMGGG